MVGQNQFFLENKVVLNFDFRQRVKSGHSDHLLQSYGQIYFNIFRYILRKAGFLWFPTSYIKKISSLMIIIGIFLAFILNGSQRRNPLKKCFL